jgi:hypothetical protein
VKKNWFVSDPTIVLFPSIVDGFFDSISPFFSFFLFCFSNSSLVGKRRKCSENDHNPIRESEIESSGGGRRRRRRGGNNGSPI